MYENQEQRTQTIMKALYSFFKEGVDGMDGFIQNRLVDQSSSVSGDTPASPTEDTTIARTSNVMIGRDVSANRDCAKDDLRDSVMMEGDGNRTASNVTNDNNFDNELLLVMNKKLSFRSRANTKSYNLIEMYHEYYRLFHYTGCPIAGGFSGLEKKYKNRWRVGFQKTPEETFFIRVKALMKAIISDSAGVEEGGPSKWRSSATIGRV